MDIYTHTHIKDTHIRVAKSKSLIEQLPVSLSMPPQFIYKFVSDYICVYVFASLFAYVCLLLHAHPLQFLAYKLIRMLILQPKHAHKRT